MDGASVLTQPLEIVASDSEIATIRENEAFGSDVLISDNHTLWRRLPRSSSIAPDYLGLEASPCRHRSRASEDASLRPAFSSARDGAGARFVESLQRSSPESGGAGCR